MNKTNYYEKLYDDIKLEMSYYTNQSGFQDDILNDTFTKKEVKKDVITYINNIYKNKKTTIDTSKFKKRLNNKIDDFLEVENFTIVDHTEIDTFVNEMAKIYQNKIIINKHLESIAFKFLNLTKYINIIRPILLITFIALFIINIKFIRNKNLSVILYTNVFLILSTLIYIKSRVRINHIFIYNELISELAITIIHNLILTSIITMIIYFIIATINIVLKKVE